MFANTAMTSWNIDMPNLVFGGGMFQGAKLQSFEGDLSSLVMSYESYPMFGTDYKSDEKNKLSYFRSNLSSLKCGYKMFVNCPLDQGSIDHIANVINDISHLQKDNDEDWKYDYYNGLWEKGTTFNETKSSIYPDYRGVISLSCADGVDFTSAVEKMNNKGWIVLIGGGRYEPS
jgi:hypothetical protein